MNLGLAGKTVIVTGAASGIGATIAERFVAEGANVVIADIDIGKAQARADALSGRDGQAMAVATDVTGRTSVEAMVGQAVARFGAVHVLVNNAGLTRDMRIGKMTEADWDLVVDVILKGAFLCSKAVMELFQGQGWGRIINISSRAYLGNAGQANYSAAKAGLLGFTRALALEAGRSNVTVNAVAPGIIDTEMVRALPHFAKIEEAARGRTPLQRLGSTDDVADAVLFLASERAGYITGDVVHVTGGRY